VLVIVQPVLPAPASNGHIKTNLTPEELGWPPGFFEQTEGSLADDPIERPPQGEFVIREELV